MQTQKYVAMKDRTHSSDPSVHSQEFLFMDCTQSKCQEQHNELVPVLGKLALVVRD